ncbi:MAG: phosphate transport system regulatory protein PhoU [Candidatus Lambdaproteobacteria bacterium RIFOXYD2_FULL_50_16]|uniref:Phosphate-specific transport system accessory protein PhoU n=1 Tax=Candidatus Lambdaproteobacteria bacterium RIFOXYD2_FULL_50_16 TaxID=1817772 RepID=A0A1F6GDQ0_9PROT|nr:MAG: phosphate transport system regulatory protein PhoU [Candidatus Lambdaproteobacteria bacterium RIFOXYD2_FULL_50_16]
MTIQLQKEIERLKSQILSMSAKVEKNFHDITEAVETVDVETAKRMIAGDDDINTIELEIEEECLKILALHQPVAVDLRLIISILKINNELERINDCSVNIGERVLDLSSQSPCVARFDIKGMAKKVGEMFSKSLDSLLNMDLQLAIEVCSLDDEVDQQNKEIFAQVTECIRTNPNQVGIMLQYASISRYLERIADLVSNIAEDVIYLIEGYIVRHQDLDDLDLG